MLTSTAAQLGRSALLAGERVGEKKKTKKQTTFLDAEAIRNLAEPQSVREHQRRLRCFPHLVYGKGRLSLRRWTLYVLSVRKDTEGALAT